MTSKPLIIGFTGIAGSGKSTAAEHLVARHGFIRVAFAGTLKTMARAVGIDQRHMSGDLKEAPCDFLCGKSPRQFMQLLGHEFGRNLIGPDFWVEIWLNQVKTLSAQERSSDRRPMIVADDVRYPNEAAAIRSLGGCVIGVVRPGAGSASGAAHPSENQALPLDGVIENRRAIDGFRRKVDDMLRQIDE